MKFAQHLAVHMTPEWRNQYMKYDALKTFLYAKVAEAPGPIDKEERSAFLRTLETEFFSFIREELSRVDDFYMQKLSEYDAKFRSLKNELSHPQIGIDDYRRVSPFQTTISQKRKYEVYRGFRELYLGLVLLQNYQDLNYSGFCKIMKKYDKSFDSVKGKQYLVDTVQEADFHREYHKLDALLRDTEDLVTEEFEHGNRSKAMDKLKVPPLGKGFGQRATFLIGTFTGALMVIVLVGSFALYMKIDDKVHDWRTFLRFYRPAFLLNFHLLLLGLNMYFWKYYGVNHLIIFELNPRDHLEPPHFLMLAGFLNCVTGLSAIVHLYSVELGIPIYSSPFALVIFYLLFLFNPFKFGFHSARIWLLKKIVRILLAPVFYVEFADFWLTDQLSSLTPVFLDLHYITCFYLHTKGVFQLPVAISTDCSASCHCNDPRTAIRPVIRILPELLRFLQCCRRYYSKPAYTHIMNALKYGMTFFVVLFSGLQAARRAEQRGHMSKAVEISIEPVFTLWILFATLNSFYGYYWDVVMDWGLFNYPRKGENRFLRQELIYPSKFFYYIAMLIDLLLRFLWAFSLSLSEMGIVQGDYSVTLMAPLEIFRRFVWNFIRLENEHLNNCGQYRAIRDLSIMPMRVRKEETDDMLTMMDLTDGLEIVRLRHSSVSLLSKKNDSTPHFPLQRSGRSSLLSGGT